MSLSNKDLPLVSISMAAYNHERYVQAAIQSVIDQDYPRIELIVIDDGSKDSTWTKIEAMRPACEKRFERVVMYTRPNRGCAVTWHEAADLRRGDYIGGIASDDQYLPGAISALVKALEDDPSVGSAVGTNIIIDADGRRCYWDEERNIVYDENAATYKTFDEFIVGYSGVDFSSDAFGSYAELVKVNHIPNGQLWRKSFADKIVIYDDKAPLEDLWSNLQMAKVAKFKHVDASTFAYRWHGANTVTQNEYMSRITRATYLRELECLGNRPDADQWKGDFLNVHHEFRDVIWKMPLVKNRFLALTRIRTWKRVQYVLNSNAHQLPLTPKLRTA